MAAEQYGVVARAQAMSLGATREGVRHRIERGEWLPLSPRVLRLLGTPRTTRSAVMASVLDAVPGSVASHRTAATLWRLPGFRFQHLDVTQPRGHDERRRCALGTLHEPRLLRPHHCTVLDGIPVTTPARTLFDLAGIEHPAKVERAVDDALSRSPALLPRLHTMLDELARRGRPGIRAMRRILADRPPGYIAPASGLERRVIQVLADAGIATRRQVDVGGDDWLGRTDLLVVGTNLVIEVDSVRHHTSRLDRERDAARDAAMAAAGFTVLRVAEEDVWTAPQAVVREVKAALRSAA